MLANGLSMNLFERRLCQKFDKGKKKTQPSRRDFFKLSAAGLSIAAMSTAAYAQETVCYDRQPDRLAQQPESWHERVVIVQAGHLAHCQDTTGVFLQNQTSVDTNTLPQNPDFTPTATATIPPGGS
jgi:hypothetical protein